jgi:hypothetical protein
MSGKVKYVFRLFPFVFVMEFFDLYKKRSMIKKESKRVVNIVLQASDIAKLTELKKSSGFSKSELVRMAINELYASNVQK